MGEVTLCILSFPVDGGFTNWSPFSQCTKTCGGGSQVRSRNCSNPKPQFGGKTCDHLGADDESRKCNTFFCPGAYILRKSLRLVVMLLRGFKSSFLSLSRVFDEETLFRVS